MRRGRPAPLPNHTQGGTPVYGLDPPFTKEDIAVSYKKAQHPGDLEILKLRLNWEEELMMTPEAALVLMQRLSQALEDLGHPFISDQDFEEYRASILDNLP